MAATVLDETPQRDAPAPASTAADRLTRTLPADRWLSWVWTLAITAFAFAVRVTGLNFPNKVVFDEVYYKNDAASLLRNLVEVNDKGEAAFVVHPPLGKWCIALGQWLVGSEPVNWRIPAAIAGTISVLIMVRLARRLFGSTLLGCIAGALLALDGLHFVSSRVALLDIFLMLFVLAAFACLVLDRDHRRAQIRRALLAGVAADEAVKRSGWRGVPWWRVASAVLLGCALGVKWSALYYLVPFIVIAAVLEARTVRAAGVKHWVPETVHRELWLAIGFGALTVLTYLATWAGWFISDNGWDRHWAETTGNSVWYLPDALHNLWHYHQAVYGFHKGLHDKHVYQSSPYSWLFLGRPVAYFYEGGTGCGASACSREIIALGNPALWWFFLPALVASAWQWIARRDWRAGSILLLVVASLAPWMLLPGRTMFFFYALPALPFLVLAVTITLGMVLGRRGADADRRLAGAILVCSYLVLVGLSFWFFHPIYTGELITYEQWQSRMWLDSWV